MESSSSSGSSKRAKAPGNIAQPVSCLVDGCSSDLGQCKEYHRRHKVCELHSKTSKVTIGGQEQRFCQQCSRFHSLGEFDEGKRSCRKRLDGHNRRRRKPQTLESVSRNTGRFLSNYSSTRYYIIVIQHQNLPGSSAHNDRGRSQFQILQGTNTLFPEASACQPPDPNSTSGNSGRSHKMLSDELNQVINTDCALSLLSSAPAETREIGLSPMVQPDPITPAHSLIHDMHYSSLGHYPCLQGMESKPVVSDFNTDGSDNANLHSQGMFQNVTDGSSPSESHQQMFSFRWE
ncbi:hypothetical protein F0562_033133 [Nyssa sinensis]|uniref:SBP-type domain-containing protein n=1 Tax=Nyssa sinensis TaxID=561372 RepID=A0A5J5ASS7_9ASTE|nr:hypothetical protein F0562_033133 [Nyssa sinensis]